MHIDVDEARLLLLAAVSLTRGDLDSYVVARLAQFGYDRARVEGAARRLVEAAHATEEAEAAAQAEAAEPAGARR